MKKNMMSLIVAMSLGSLASATASAKPNTDATTLNPSAPPQPTQAAPHQVAWLGVHLAELSPAMQQQLGGLLGDAGGVVIARVQNDSPAQQGGLKNYDILISIDDQPVQGVQHIHQAIQARQPNQPVKLGLIRNAAKTELSLMLGARQRVQQHRQRLPNPLQNRFNQGFNQPLWATPPGWVFPQWQQPQWPGFNVPQPNPLQNGANMHSFSQSESMNWRTLPDGRLRAEIKTRDSDGNDKEFVFEGDKEAIKKQLESQTELPEQQKQNLLRSLEFGSNPGSLFGSNPWSGLQFGGFPSLNFNDPFFQPQQPTRPSPNSNSQAPSGQLF